MNSFEGSGNIINVSREQFLAGPRNTRTEQFTSRHVLAPVFYLPREEGVINDLSYPENGNIDEDIEMMVMCGTAGIIEQYLKYGYDDEAIRLSDLCVTACARGLSAETVRQMAIGFTERVDEKIYENAVKAYDITLAETLPAL